MVYKVLDTVLLYLLFSSSEVTSPSPVLAPDSALLPPPLPLRGKVPCRVVVDDELLDVTDVLKELCDDCCNNGAVSSSVSTILSNEDCRFRRDRASPFVKTLRLQIGHSRLFSVSQTSMQSL